jgi:hypothetical protein
MAIVLIDSLILKVSRFFFEENDYSNLVVFSALLIVSVSSQYGVLKIIGNKIQKFPSSGRSYFFHRLNSIVPFSLLFFIFVILLEMVLSNVYHMTLVITTIWITFSISLLNMSVLIFQLFQWLKFNKNYVVISYTITIISILLNLTISLTSVTHNINSIPDIIHSSYNPVKSFSAIPKPMELIYELTNMTTFITMWLSSTLLLSHYAKKYGFIKFAIVSVMQLVYFLVILSPLLDIILQQFSSNYPYLVNLIDSYLDSTAKPIGGFLLALVFWSGSKAIDNKVLREHVIIAGFGIMTLFTSNQLINLMRPDFPPFGLITLSFFGIGCYISLIGIYGSAMCVAQDRELRQILRKSTEKNMNMFNQIGKSQMEKKLMATANSAMKKLKDESGVQTVEDEDYKKYIDEAIREIQKEKTTNN